MVTNLAAETEGFGKKSVNYWFRILIRGRMKHTITNPKVFIHLLMIKSIESSSRGRGAVIQYLVVAF